MDSTCRSSRWRGRARRTFSGDAFLHDAGARRRAGVRRRRQLRARAGQRAVPRLASGARTIRRACSRLQRRRARGPAGRMGRRPGPPLGRHGRRHVRGRARRPERRSLGPRQPRAGRCGDLSRRTGKFVVDSEPIGAAEVPQPSRRDNEPAAFFAQGLLARIFDVGTTFHCEDCLVARVPGPVQQRAPRRSLPARPWRTAGAALHPCRCRAPRMRRSHASGRLSPQARVFAAVAPSEGAGPGARRVRAATADRGHARGHHSARVAVGRAARLARREDTMNGGDARDGCLVPSRLRAAMMRPTRGLLPMNRRVFCQSLGLALATLGAGRTAGRRRLAPARPPGAGAGSEGTEIAWLNDLSAVRAARVARLAHLERHGRRRKAIDLLYKVHWPA